MTLDRVAGKGRNLPGREAGMSRHMHVTPSGLRIVAGWDRPLGHHFLEVYDDRVTPGEEGHVVYHTMHDVSLMDRGRPRHLFGGLSLEELDAKLAEHSLTLPAAMRAQLEADARVNAGNDTRTF